MAFKAGEICFGLDLRQAALGQVDFLQAVDKKVELLEEGSQAVLFAIQRYEKLWLPLAAKYSDRFLAAPIDIEWIWHCHLLNPASYERDCRRVVGKVVDHKLLDRERRKQSLQESRVLWRHEYPSVPFEADGPISPWFDSDFTPKISYNLRAAVVRQQVFFYQVSLPHYKDEKFIGQAILRYKKFLHLKMMHPNTFIVPCYDIDLVWHTHMLHPVIYRQDTVRIVGHPFNHDDSVNDRRAGSKLTVSDARTRRIWKKTFDEPFSQSGAMFRGEPPAGKLLCLEASDLSALVTKQTTVLLESARVTGLPEHYQGQYKLKLWYNTGYQNFNRALYVSDSIATVRGSPRHLTNDVRVNANFTFDTKYNDVVMVDLIQKSGRFCLGATAEVGSAQLRMLEKIQALGNGRGVTSQDTVDLGDGVGVQLQWSVTPPVTGGCILALKSGDYQDCIMPEMLESMWGPVPLPRLPPGVDNKCSVASHSLLNHTKRVVFTVRIVHSLPLMMSAVHVFFKDKMAAVGHLVGADQLPLPQLVKNQDRSVTLDIKNGERAVLLKNHAGDWGVVLGRWTGMRKPVPATETSSGRRGIPGDPGHLEIRFFKFSTRHWRFLSFERDYTGTEHKFQIEAATVELDSGLIEVSSEAGNEIAENLALAFSVALLHVLCQPRPKDWDPSTENAEDSTDGQAAKGRPRMAAEGLALILAAGFLALAPSNHLLRKRHREALEAQAEEDARKQRQEEEEEDERRRQEASGSDGPWGARSDDYSQDGTDVGSEAGMHDVVAIVTAEDRDEDLLPTDPHRYSLPHHHHEVSDEGVEDSATGQSGREAGLSDHPAPRSGEPHRLQRLPSIAENKEEEAAEAVQTDSNTTPPAEEGADPACHNPEHSFDMTAMGKDLRDLDSADPSACPTQEPLCHQVFPMDDADLNSGFPLPVEDLPLPSEELLRLDDSYPSPDEDLPLPDVPDDDLPLPVEELPPPDWSSLREPQAEALQMSCSDNQPLQNYHAMDNPGRLHRHSAVDFDEDNPGGVHEHSVEGFHEDGLGDFHEHNAVDFSEDGFQDLPDHSAVGFDEDGLEDLHEPNAVGFDENSAVGYEEYLDLNPDHSEDVQCHLSNGFDDYLTDHLGDNYLSEDLGVGGVSDGYEENHIPQDDYSHWNGDLDHGDDSSGHHCNYADAHSDFAFQPDEHLHDMGADIDFSSKDVNGDDHFDMYDGTDDVNDLFVSDSNYISYEDTSNYDGFCADDFSGGGGSGGDWGGFYGNCDGGEAGGGGDDSGGMGNMGGYLLLGGGDMGGDGGGGAACGGGGGEGGGCGGCGG